MYEIDLTAPPTFNPVRSNEKMVHLASDESTVTPSAISVAAVETSAASLERFTVAPTLVKQLMPKVMPLLPIGLLPLDDATMDVLPEVLTFP